MLFGFGLTRSEGENAGREIWTLFGSGMHWIKKKKKYSRKGELSNKHSLGKIARVCIY